MSGCGKSRMPCSTIAGWLAGWCCAVSRRSHLSSDSFGFCCEHSLNILHGCLMQNVILQNLARRNIPLDQGINTHARADKQRHSHGQMHEEVVTQRRTEASHTFSKVKQTTGSTFRQSFARPPYMKHWSQINITLNSLRKPTKPSHKKQDFH